MRSILIGSIVLGSWAAPARAELVTVLFGDRAHVLKKAAVEAGQLWVPTADLTRVTGFVLKPEGACLESLCIPISRTEADGYLRRRDGQEQINLTKFASTLKQAVAVEAGERVWSFGPVPAVRQSRLEGLTAPDFTLIDRKGKPVRLADFRGKKVLLLTWASW
jgi:hypothetical protein